MTVGPPLHRDACLDRDPLARNGRNDAARFGGETVDGELGPRDGFLYDQIAAPARRLVEGVRTVDARRSDRTRTAPRLEIDGEPLDGDVLAIELRRRAWNADFV